MSGCFGKANGVSTQVVDGVVTAKEHVPNDPNPTRNIDPYSHHFSKRSQYHTEHCCTLEGADASVLNIEYIVRAFKRVPLAIEEE